MLKRFLLRSRLASDSLTHFVVLGAIFFGIYHFNNDVDAASTQTVVIDAQQIDDMKHAFSDAKGRHPAKEELNAMIALAVNQEVLFREGLKRGLDKDDDIIKKRVMMRMEFLLDAMTAIPEPSDQQLQDFLASNIELFQEENRYSFSHIFFRKDTATDSSDIHDADHANNAIARANAVLALMESPAVNETPDNELTVNNAYKKGDAFPRSYHLWKATQTDINRIFGIAFGSELKKMTRTGHWVGPVKSVYGWHLVYVKDITLAAAPTLAEHYDAVKTAWEKQQKVLAKQQLIASMTHQYAIRIEHPEDHASATLISQNTASRPE